MPAARISSTSCHRFSWRDPGAFVGGNSSTTSTSGWRFRQASRFISSMTTSLYWTGACDHLEVADARRRVGATVRLDVADHDVDALAPHGVRIVEHPNGLADARGHTEVHLQLPLRRLAAGECEEVFGAARLVPGSHFRVPSSPA